MCRDNIDALLANAVPHDRQIEKTARTWLHTCHQKLDKTTMYDDMLPEQQLMRKRFGEQCTFFRTMCDGTRTIQVPSQDRAWSCSSRCSLKCS